MARPALKTDVQSQSSLPSLPFSLGEESAHERLCGEVVLLVLDVLHILVIPYHSNVQCPSTKVDLYVATSTADLCVDEHMICFGEECTPLLIALFAIVACM
eukprot:1160697-Pelagomonas_calceolata.AAC.2